MRFKTSKIVASIAVIGAVAAGGAAFTASSGLPSSSAAGYDTSTVDGATVSNLHYVLKDNGANIDTAELSFSSELTGKTVTAGFANGVAADNIGACTPTLAIAPLEDTVSCVFTGEATVDADSFYMAVVNTP